MTDSLRIAVVGAGPAGIYAADLIVKGAPDATVDIIDRDPTPFGLIRYGVAPDHPRIKAIIGALTEVLGHPRIRFLGNIELGTDLALDDLRRHYHAVVLATGARRDRELGIPGEELQGSFGSADFVSWYDAHPDAPRTWDFEDRVRAIAVIGAGNVGIDVARVLAKQPEELLATEIPEHVYRGLRENTATEIHLFARRGPAQAKFTPMELRELAHSPNVHVEVDPDGFVLDQASEEAIAGSKVVQLVVSTLRGYLETPAQAARRRIVIHFCQSPVEVLGHEGRVTALRTEVTELDGDGHARGTGRFVDWPVEAVYRAVGYRSEPVPGIPFDPVAAVIPNDGGRVMTGDRTPLPGVYVTGWVKRGPVGLIGHTKSDAAQTIGLLLEDAAGLAMPPCPDPASFTAALDARGVAYTTMTGFEAIDAAERALGEQAGRSRVKIAERGDLVAVARAALVSATS